MMCNLVVLLYNILCTLKTQVSQKTLNLIIFFIKILENCIAFLKNVYILYDLSIFVRYSLEEFYSYAEKTLQNRHSITQKKKYILTL